MKRHLKSAAQLLLIWLDIAGALIVAGAVMQAIDPLKQVV